MSAPGSLARDRRLWIVLAMILLLALALRLTLVLGKGNRIYFADTFEYLHAAHGMLAGQGPGGSFPRAPVYPGFMALGFLLFGYDNLLAVRLLQLPFGIANVAMCWFLGSRIGRPQHGLLAALIATASPTLAFTAGMLYPTAIYTALILAITLAVWELDRRPRLALGALLGVLMALVLMTDQVAVGPIVAALAWLAWGIRRQGRRLLLALAAALAIAVLAVAPLFAYYRSVYHRQPIFMEKAQAVLWYERRAPRFHGLPAVRDTSAFRVLSTAQFVEREWGLLRDQPAGYLVHYGTEFLHFFWPLPDRVTTRNFYTQPVFRIGAGAYFLPVLLLSLVGLAAGVARRRDRLLLILLVLATDALYSLFFTQMRYRTPVEPQLMVLAALGATRLFPRASDAVTRFVLRLGRVEPAPVGWRSQGGAGLPAGRPAEGLRDA